MGYSRAVRVGNMIFISGTTATDAAGAIVGATAYAQAQQALRNLQRGLEMAGATLADVVRTRVFVRHITDWEEVGRAHGEVFANIRPVSTMVEVSGFVSPAMLVEIEADAILDALGPSQPGSED